MTLPGYPTEPFPKVMFDPDEDFTGIAPNGRFLRRNRVAVSVATVGTTSAGYPVLHEGAAGRLTPRTGLVVEHFEGRREETRERRPSGRADERPIGGGLVHRQ
jgi:hypothetical protein